MADPRMNRTNVTTASRVMLPTYPVLAFGLGLNYALTDRTRLAATPVLAAGDAILPLPVWGAAFLTIAAALTYALLGGSFRIYWAALAAMIALLLVWAAVFAVAAVYGQGSPGAFLWPLFGAAACTATIRSLTTREVTP